MIMLLLCICSLFLAAARPAWGRRILPQSAAGRDIMVLFDTSKSMLSDDVKPSRMAHAKWLVREIVKQNPGDRFGLISFAGESILACPLTIDQTGFLQILDGLDTSSVGLGGTNIAGALDSALETFKNAEGAHKAILLITDGDELTGNARKAIQTLNQQKIPLFIAGIGDPANPGIIRIRNASSGQMETYRDRNGNPVSSPLNEDMLLSLARESGGIYVRSTTVHPNLDALEKRIQALDTKELDDSLERTVPIERKAWPAGAALIFLLIYLFTGERKNAVSRQTLAAGAVWFSAILLLYLTLPSQDLSAQDVFPPPEEPVPVDTEPAATPQTPEEWFNLGVQAQENNESAETILNDYAQAVAAAGEQEQETGSERAKLIRSKAYLNIGSVHHAGAQKTFSDAKSSLQNGSIPQTEDLLKQTEKSLSLAEENYGESLRESTDQTRDMAVNNQKKILRFRKEVDLLKQEIEKLKDLQKQAQQSTSSAQQQNQQAMDQQQNQQNQQNSGENQQQNQQNQQNSGENQQQSQQNQQA